MPIELICLPNDQCRLVSLIDFLIIYDVNMIFTGNQTLVRGDNLDCHFIGSV